MSEPNNTKMGDWEWGELGEVVVSNEKFRKSEKFRSLLQCEDVITNHNTGENNETLNSRLGTRNQQRQYHQYRLGCSRTAQGSQKG